MPPDALKGKILLFNHAFDKELATNGNGGMAYVGGVVYRWRRPHCRGRAGRGGCSGALCGRSRLSAAAHRHDRVLAGRYPRFTAAAVTAEDAETLKYLTGQGPVTMHITLTPQTLPDAESYKRDRRLAGHRSIPNKWSSSPATWIPEGPRPGRNRRRRGSGGLHAGHSLAQRAGHPSQTHRALHRLDERRGGIGGRGAIHEGSTPPTSAITSAPSRATSARITRPASTTPASPRSARGCDVP